MPLNLDAADRRILAGSAAVLALLLAAAALLAPVQESESPRVSSYSYDSNGAAAAYTLLPQLGYGVQRWVRPPAELPTDAWHYTLVLAEPVAGAGKPDRAALQRFLHRGGRILGTGAAAGPMLTEADFEPAVSWLGWTHFPVAAAGPLAAVAPQITMQPEATWATQPAGELALYGTAGHAVVVIQPAGGGELEWWAGPTPLLNAGLREPGNLELLLHALGPPGKRQILWDEYYHGERPGLWLYMAATPLRFGLWPLGLLLVSVLWTFSRRSGPIHVPPSPSRLSVLEFVDTLGGVYQRAHDPAIAVEVAYQRLRALLLRRLGLGAGASAEAADLDHHLPEAAARCFPDVPGLAATLRRCQEAQYAHLSDPQALALVQQMHELTRHLRLETPTS